MSHTLNQTNVRKCTAVKPNSLSPYSTCVLFLFLFLSVINALLFFIVPVFCDPATMSCLDVDLDNQWEWSAAVGARVFLLALIPAKACWGRPLSRLSHTPLSLMTRLPQAAGVIIIMTKRARRAKRPAEGERGNGDRIRKKERKSKWVWSIVNFTKSLRCVSGVNKWINLSVGLWSVTPYCWVPSGARPSNLSYLFSLLHTLAFIHIKTHTHTQSKLPSYSAKWKIFGFTYAHTETCIKLKTPVTLIHWDIGVFIILLLAPFFEHNKPLEAVCYSDFTGF